MKFNSIIFFLFTTICFSQTKNEFETIDLKMSKIPNNSTSSSVSIAKYIAENFKTESEKIRAVYYFTASNISYDVEKFKYILQNPKTVFLVPQTERIENTLQSKKGVCQDYSELFSEIANLLQIKTYVVPGYTKQNGEISIASHAWCASKIEGKWLLFDPTWAAGYVNNDVFSKKLENKFFKVSPTDFISTHIPFDYLYQFLNYTITNQEFYDGKTQVNKAKPFFNYDSEIIKYEKLSIEEKAKKAAERIEKNGLKNDLITNYLAEKKSQKSFESLSKISTDYNETISLYNDFINFRNNQFKPEKTDFEIQKMVSTIKEKISDIQNRTETIEHVDKQNLETFEGLKKSIKEFKKSFEEHELFVEKYLKKNKLGRKMMFTNVSIFGIPVNKN